MLAHILGEDVDGLIHKHVAAMRIQKNWRRILEVHEGLIDTVLEMEVWWNEVNCGIFITSHNIRLLEFVASRFRRTPFLQGVSSLWRKIILLTVRAGIMCGIRENQTEKNPIILRMLSAYDIISVCCGHRFGKRLRKMLINEYEVDF